MPSMVLILSNFVFLLTVDLQVVKINVGGAFLSSVLTLSISCSNSSLVVTGAYCPEKFKEAGWPCLIDMNVK